jgi:hypothetical protein
MTNRNLLQRHLKYAIGNVKVPTISRYGTINKAIMNRNSSMVIIEFIVLFFLNRYNMKKGTTRTFSGKGAFTRPQ